MTTCKQPKDVAAVGWSRKGIAAMKRLGVRIAGGVGVIFLGILAAVQAQKDGSSVTSELEREFQDGTPAAPITAFDNAPWENESAIYRGNDGLPQPATNNVQLAGHEEPAAPPAAQPPADPAMMPEMNMGEMDGPSMAMPGAAVTMQPIDSAAAPPAAAMNLPTDAEAQPAAAPVNMLRSGPEEMPAMNMGAAPAEALAAQNTQPLDVPADDPQANLAMQMGPSDGAEISMPSMNPPAADAAAMPTMNYEADAMSVPAMTMTDAPTMADAPAMTMGDPPAMAPAADAGSPFTATADANTPAPQDLDATSNANLGTPPSLTPPAYGAPDTQPAAAPQMEPLAVAATLSAAPAAALQAQSYAPLAAAAPIAGVASRDTQALSAMGNVQGSPGDRRWEGAQAPSVLIHKRAPEEIKVGKPATFVIDVRNVGTTDAFNVQIHDRVPDGMRLVDAMPQPTGTPDALTWSLGGLEPGGERSITMQLVAESEGELGSVARVTFEAAASVRTMATRPELRIRQRAPERVLIGQQLELEIDIENIGTGTASGVILQEDVPEGLEHPKGRQLDNLLGDLRPGETRTQVLRLRATAAGKIENIVRLISDDGLDVQDAVAVEVVAPQVAVELRGPSKRYLERQATYNVAVANVGTANATNVEVVAYLDRGFSFVSTENEGQYDPSRHAVYWSLSELPVGANGSVPLTLLPIEEGEQAVRLELTGDLNVREKTEKMVTIDTLAELSFSVADSVDPVELGAETTYEIRVSNSGSRGDSNVQLQIKLPPDLELVSADRNAGTDGQGLIAFEPLTRLSSQQEEIYRLKVRGNRAGMYKIQAILTSDQSHVPVTKEESTTIYSDN